MFDEPNKNPTAGFGDTEQHFGITSFQGAPKWPVAFPPFFSLCPHVRNRMLVLCFVLFLVCIWYCSLVISRRRSRRQKQKLDFEMLEVNGTGSRQHDTSNDSQPLITTTASRWIEKE
eukprot:c2997_g1_i2.p2 GENE.c2997_g1_i2~~c2997_g1_i2.p2  ORF type:complete len:117 (+),score=11.89 c2997_g1_i2:182-532(+)